MEKGMLSNYFQETRALLIRLLGSREPELKTFEGTSGFINGDQELKYIKIKGSWEHIPPTLLLEGA